MKKSLFILSCLCFITLSTLAQRRFQVGLKAGIATSQVEGDIYSGFHKAGIDAGIFVTGKINDKWSAQLEMTFVQKGSKHVGDSEKGDYSFYYMGLNYIEVPVLFQFHQKKFTFEAGPEFGYLINNHEYNELGAVYKPLPFKKAEFCADIGVNFALFKNFSINWRYSESLLPIRGYRSGMNRWYNRGQRNIVLAFSITYKFGTNANSK